MAGEVISTRAATGADTPAILDLMKASLGEGSIPRTQAYWSWKHEQNPFGRSPVLVAEADGSIVGVRVFMRWTWHVGTRSVPAVRAVDTATHPSWQGRGIFRKLTLELAERMRSEGVAFVYNTPNHQSRPGYLKMGWVQVGRPSLWMRIERWASLPRAFRKHTYTEPDWTHERADDLPALAPDHERVAELLRLLPTSSDHLQTRMTTDYLKWRYVDCPAFRYYRISPDPRRFAFVFRLRTRRAMKELTLCEMLVAPSLDASRAAGAFLRDVIRQLAPDYVVASARGTTRSRVFLAANGFLPVPAAAPMLTVRTLDLAASSSLDPTALRRWRLSIGDLELF